MRTIKDSTDNETQWHYHLFIYSFLPQIFIILLLLYFNCSLTLPALFMKWLIVQLKNWVSFRIGSYLSMYPSMYLFIYPSWWWNQGVTKEAEKTETGCKTHDNKRRWDCQNKTGRTKTTDQIDGLLKPEFVFSSTCFLLKPHRRPGPPSSGVL